MKSTFTLYFLLITISLQALPFSTEERKQWMIRMLENPTDQNILDAAELYAGLSTSEYPYVLSPEFIRSTNQYEFFYWAFFKEISENREASELEEWYLANYEELLHLCLHPELFTDVHVFLYLLDFAEILPAEDLSDVLISQYRDLLFEEAPSWRRSLRLLELTASLGDPSFCSICNLVSTQATTEEVRTKADSVYRALSQLNMNYTEK